MDKVNKQRYDLVWIWKENEADVVTDDYKPDIMIKEVSKERGTIKRN